MQKELDERYAKALAQAQSDLETRTVPHEKKALLLAERALKTGFPVRWQRAGTDPYSTTINFISEKNGDWHGGVSFHHCGCVISSGRVPEEFALHSLCETHREHVPELVGVREVAAMLGWEPAKVSVYHSRGKLPEPKQVLASGPVWSRKQIEEWQHGNRDKD